ncbi:putative monooxygenase [Hypoxylon sp. FL1857]|nr:putative monooxygenase [Hypoxylon sp. FL1857]
MALKNTRPRVLIAGAGLSGLTLAQSLRKQNIPFEIFERDTDPISRASGWAIGLHSVLDDLLSDVPQDMPPFKDSVDHLVPLDLEAQIGFFFRGQRQVVQDTPGKLIVRANRFRFREWLSNQIPIQWGKKVIDVVDAGDEVRVHFADGTTAVGDILVGADGVNSVVREHILQRPNKETLRAVPAAIISGETNFSGGEFERQLSLAHSCYVVSSPGTPGYFLFVGLRQVTPDGNSGEYYWHLFIDDGVIEKEDHWLRSASQAEKLDYAMKLTSALEPKFTEVIRATPPSGVLAQPLNIRDGEIEDLPVGRITLLGDAIHPMTPFRGEGGVHALRDALNLGKALGRLNSNDRNEIEALLGPYQGEALERGIAATRASRNAQRVNTAGEGNLTAWGQVAVPAPEEHVSLGNCRGAACKTGA